MRTLLLSVLVPVLAGCASKVFRPGDKPFAPAGESVGAISVASSARVQSVRLETVAGTDSLSLEIARDGAQAFLIHAAPARYCLRSLESSSGGFSFPWPPDANTQCVDLVVGDPQYLGRLSITRAEDGTWAVTRENAYNADKAELETRFGPMTLMKK